MSWLRESTAVTLQLGPALDKGDAVTEETALSPTVYVSKNGAAYAARHSTDAIAHDANGWYRIPLDTTDTGTRGQLVVMFRDPTTHLPVWERFLVVEGSWYDVIVNKAGVIPVNVVLLDSVYTPLQNLLKDYDGSGYAKAASVIGTCSVLTGHTPQSGDAFARIGAGGAGLTSLGGMSGTMKGQVEYECWDALEANHLDDLVAAANGLANVKVGSIVDHVLRDGVAEYDRMTDSLQAIRDRGDAAWSLGNVTLGAIQMSVIAGNRVSSPVALDMFQYDVKVFQISVSDANGDPMSLLGRTLRFVVLDSNGVGKFDVEAAGIVIGGTNNEIASVTVTATMSATASENDWHWRLRDTVAAETLAHGPFSILKSVADVT